MSLEKFLEKTKGKKVVWGSLSYLRNNDQRAYIKQNDWIIVDGVNMNDGMIIFSKHGANCHNSAFSVDSGLFNPENPNIACWFFVDTLDDVVRIGDIINFNNSLKEIIPLIEQEKVEYNDDGTIKLDMKGMGYGE